MSKTFDELLSELHGGAGTILQDDNDNFITIDEKRNFIVGSNFDTIIAYAGDVNSQIITFKIPSAYEGHQLYECDYKKIKWKNLGNNLEDDSNLIINEEGLANWTVPPEVFSSAGKLEISISIYDIQDGKVAFSWNTPVYSGLSIGESFSKVGETYDEERLPSKDEILFIDNDTRLIVAPKGYNNTVCIYGDKNTSKVYFQIKRKIKGMDILDEKTSIKVVVRFNNNSTNDYITIENRKENFAEGSHGEGLATLIWNLPTWLTNNDLKYSGQFSISLVFINDELMQRWSTHSYKNLSIDECLPDEEYELEERPELPDTVYGKADTAYVKSNFISVPENRQNGVIPYITSINDVSNQTEGIVLTSNPGNSLNEKAAVEYQHKDNAGKEHTNYSFSVATPVNQYSPTNKEYVDTKNNQLQKDIDVLKLIAKEEQYNINSISYKTAYINKAEQALSTFYINKLGPLTKYDYVNESLQVTVTSDKVQLESDNTIILNGAYSSQVSKMFNLQIDYGTGDSIYLKIETSGGISIDKTHSSLKIYNDSGYSKNIYLYDDRTYYSSFLDANLFQEPLYVDFNTNNASVVCNNLKIKFTSSQRQYRLVGKPITEILQLGRNILDPKKAFNRSEYTVLENGNVILNVGDAASEGIKTVWMPKGTYTVELYPKDASIKGQLWMDGKTPMLYDLNNWGYKFTLGEGQYIGFKLFSVSIGKEVQVELRQGYSLDLGLGYEPYYSPTKIMDLNLFTNEYEKYGLGNEEGPYYGLYLNENEYNYIDFEKKSLVCKVEKKNGKVVRMDNEKIIDISHILDNFQDIITMDSGNLHFDDDKDCTGALSEFLFIERAEV